MSKIRHLTIYTDKIKSDKKILVYSDLHLGFKRGINVDKLIENSTLAPENYDCILIPGDIIHCTNVMNDKIKNEEVLSFLATITGSTPVYYTLGNHDQYIRHKFEKWQSDLTRAVVKNLDSLSNFNFVGNNTLIRLDDISIRGLNLSPSYYLDKNESETAFLEEAQSQCSSDKISNQTFNIFMVHDPKSIYRISKKSGACIFSKTDLVISGHMHNALVPNVFQKLLRGRGLISPDFTILPDFSYGVKEVGKTLFMINGAINSFIENELINDLYGFNCTEIVLHTSDKKLVYSYK